MPPRHSQAWSGPAWALQGTRIRSQALADILDGGIEERRERTADVAQAHADPDVHDNAVRTHGLGRIADAADPEAAIVEPEKADHVVLIDAVTRNADGAHQRIAAIDRHRAREDLDAVGKPLLAARRTQNEVHHKDFLDALEKIVLGPERPILLSHADRERIAYHEGGHAILGLVVPGADPVNRVTIVPRGQALGITYQRPQSDRYNYPEPYLRARIIGMLGGRAAEEIVYGTKTTGAENDIEQATDLARRMVTRWGMSDRLGLVQLAAKDNPYLNGFSGNMGSKPFSEDTAKAIDAEVLKIIHESHELAKELLTAHRKQLDALAEALLSHETLNELEILEITGLPPSQPLDTGLALPTTTASPRGQRPPELVKSLE